MAVSWALDLKSHGVHVLGAIPSGLPALGIPHVDWSWDLIQKLLPVAFAILPIFAFANAGVSLAGLGLDALLEKWFDNTGWLAQLAPDAPRSVVVDAADRVANREELE